MASIILNHTLDLGEKYLLMREDTRYDIVSSMEVLAPDVSDITRSIRSKKALLKTPKIFLSNECIFNCAYCNCRSGNDCKRTYQTSPRELADFSIKVAADRGPGGSGIFISSAIFRTPDYTAELINETLRIIRQEHCYTGYLHAKIMPGTSLELIRQAGQYADRLSINIEVAKSEGYSKIAVNKNKNNILTPMGQISDLIKAARAERSPGAPRFATSQTTQMMVGSLGEDDYTVLNLSAALYKKYKLKRVYYTAYEFNNPASGYDLPLTKTPLWRVHRMYQADKLVQDYGFSAEEVAPETARNLRQDLDPKAAWALRNLHLFPVEVNTADYELLLKIPGIGVTFAKRILAARRQHTITHDLLGQLGISPKKSRHFLTCNGKFTGNASGDSAILYYLLADLPETGCGNQLFFDLGGVARVPGLRPLHA